MGFNTIFTTDRQQGGIVGKKEGERQLFMVIFSVLKRSLHRQNQGQKKKKNQKTKKKQVIAEKRTNQGMAGMLLPGSRISKEVWKLSGIKYSSGESFLYQ